MKKNSKSSLFVVLIITLLFLCFYFPNTIADMKQKQHTLLQKVTNIQEKGDFLQSNFALNNQMTGLRAQEIFCIESYSEGNLLSVMAKNKPILIYRFTKQSCEKCYIDALTELQNEIQDGISANPDFVKVFCSHETEREILILKRTHKFSFPIYRIPPDAFKWVAEESSKPYYFLVHPDMKISHIYVPDSNYPELNKQYLEGVKRLITD